MKLSRLQKFILQQSYDKGKKVPRSQFYKFYDGKKLPPKAEDKVKILTKSLERLIDRGLLVGFGEITEYKWYIREVKLTNRGKAAAKKLLGVQAVLPLRK